ncbi:hypothetical protein F4779DRAFT_160063 [Xylariaceae sp. FL0662B]|nr:hypothetical protein F4779DRAFT_160063 [Xylariaceae sp. FL0662B]
MAAPFNPNKYVPDYQRVSDLEHVDGIWVRPKVTGREKGYAEDEIIIALAGELSHNGGKQHGAGGVYLGPENEWNKIIHYLFEDSNGKTTQLNAAHEAIEKSWTICNLQRVNPQSAFSASSPPKRIIIKSDSNFLAEAMTSAGISALKARGWETLDGEEVRLEDRETVERIEPRMAEVTESGPEVFFWHVSKEENSDAYKMAEYAYMAEPC